MQPYQVTRVPLQFCDVIRQQLPQLLGRSSRGLHGLGVLSQMHEPDVPESECADGEELLAEDARILRVVAVGGRRFAHNVSVDRA